MKLKLKKYIFFKSNVEGSDITKKQLNENTITLQKKLKKKSQFLVNKVLKDKIKKKYNPKEIVKTDSSPPRLAFVTRGSSSHEILEAIK
jgi:hypothetical protein